ncbi:MAG: hypothetical protein K2Q21_05655 [Chitinophagaceae bacterium]|nr:hypothetical protein [Chitinophagaceae bacterium]
MKKMMLALIMGLTVLSSYGQERKDLVVSIATGQLTSPYYYKNTMGSFFSVDFDYHLSKRHILTANYSDGKHNYYDKYLQADPNTSRSDGTNTRASYRTFSILYKYQFLNSKIITGNIGAGAGIMTHIQRIITGYPASESNWSDLVFPARFELDYKISNSFRLGLIGGFYIHPDYPILAYHLGPRIGYLIK